ncbi:MAG: hypothetical protein K9K64_09445 [Desulfohalobiaceae bacterium]|nr:hypothetical protein [Desulfohalobiaceae bacterium]
MPFEPDFERLKTAVRLEEPDRVPLLEVLVHYSIQSAFLGRTVTHEAISDQIAFWSQAGYDYLPLTVGMMSPGKVTQDSAISKVIQERIVSGEEEQSWNLEKNSFIANREDFERFPWDALSELDFKQFEQAGHLLPEKMKIVALSGKIFTLTWMILGFNNFATKLILDKGLVADVFQKVGQIQMDCVERIVNTPQVGAVWLVDDLAFGAGPMINPDMLRTYVFSWYKKIIQRCHENGVLVFLHSDGDLSELMDDIVDMGIDLLHPIDPTCQDIVAIKKRYGHKLAIAGNVSNELLRSGSPAEVEERVKYLIKNVAPGGGYFVCSGNSVAEWSRMENYMAMRAAAFRYGSYPIRL